jgi:NADH-quinone oxidoreductase subunit J
MTIYAFLFYLLAVLTLTATAMAVTRRHMVHAVLYLVLSFFGTALLFYLLGAPILAALEVIIYAGAIMVLFLFIIMMIRTEKADDRFFPFVQWWPALLITIGFLVGLLTLVRVDLVEQKAMTVAQALPQVFAIHLFRQHWLGIEIASLLLLIALVGVLHLSRRRHRRQPQTTETSS